MKKFLSILLCLVMIFSLSSCGSREEASSDDNEVSMFVGLGNSQEYYESLKKSIWDNLGINIRFVYQRSEDTSNSLALEFEHNDLPADIVITATKLESEILEDSCMDMVANSTITDKFSYSKIIECASEDGCVYQLPFSTRLIGITYNKTLLEEMGWKLPESLDEMKELKSKCDAAGIQFAVCGGFATGHGFNWLFHTMGSQWLSTLDGTTWINDYLTGENTVAAFKEEADYFREYVESGLFGSFYDSDWEVYKEFQRTRALFLYDITNSVYGYDGPEFDEEGNEIPGTELHDVYGTMPWISENGDNNCFTYYDNMYLAVNRSVLADKNKLDNVLKILDFMASDTATDIFSALYPDGYVAVEGYKIDESRIYSEFAGKIEQGYLQPWYYNYFDADTIVNTGEVINSYVRGDQDTCFDDVIETLDTNNRNRINKKIINDTEIKKDFTFEETAELVAIAGAQALQDALDAAGMGVELQASLMAYTEKFGDFKPWTSAPVLNTKLYQGGLSLGYFKTVSPVNANAPVAVRLKGSEILNLVKNGIKFTDADGGEASSYPVTCVTKNNIEIKDDKEYLVAVNKGLFSEKQFSEYLSSNRVIMSPDDSTVPVSAALNEGLTDYFCTNPEISPDSLSWT